MSNTVAHYQVTINLLQDIYQEPDSAILWEIKAQLKQLESNLILLEKSSENPINYSLLSDICEQLCDLNDDLDCKMQ
ncbi:MAG TPA: hypothetical protein DCF68_21180 [Cyanothece sp. UBA12306]|nr:hypothetical protein [Cyanothece sp. UBA12306]